MQTPAEQKLQTDLLFKYSAVLADCRAIIRDTGSGYAAAIGCTLECIGSMIRDFEIPPSESAHISDELQHIRIVLRKRFHFVHKEAKWIARYKDEPIPRDDMKVRLVPRYIANQGD